MSSHISNAIREQVASRANNVCEYCLIAEEDSYFRHQIEHIVSVKHGGSSDLENLALACVFCNRNKGSDIAAAVPGTQRAILLHNPRTDRWADNFRINGVVIEPLTECGEATVRILQMNHNDRIIEREILSRRGNFPSNAAKLLVFEH
ncbi:MAG: HNH endonuclease [Pyrinomonadaceae bacterium]|nr:HNH endonuclease [Pyrinomonadaceae bacterium]